MEEDVAQDDEFTKRKPIDKIWLMKEYPIRPWPLQTALQWHREMVQPKMLNSMDSFVWARLRLDMTTAKKVRYSMMKIQISPKIFQTKFLESIKGLVTFPHYFEDRPRKNVVLFCRVRNTSFIFSFNPFFSLAS